VKELKKEEFEGIVCCVDDREELEWVVIEEKRSPLPPPFPLKGYMYIHLMALKSPIFVCR